MITSISSCLLKVYKDTGLCITLYDITKIGDSYVFPGDGSAHVNVTFRFIVFRPWMEEILIGKIRCCSPEGVHGNPPTSLFTFTQFKE